LGISDYPIKLQIFRKYLLLNQTQSQSNGIIKIKTKAFVRTNFADSFVSRAKLSLSYIYILITRLWSREILHPEQAEHLSNPPIKQIMGNY